MKWKRHAPPRPKGAELPVPDSANACVRTLFSSATLALFVVYGWTLHPAAAVWGVLAVMCLLYQAMIWTRETWWTRPRYVGAVGLALALALAISLFDGGQVYASVLLIPLVLMIVMLYFMIFRPQSQQRKRQEKLLKALKSGDKVVTASGIVGQVITVKDRTVSLRSADAKMEVTKASVTDILESSSSTDSKADHEK